jgi:hypothetical protein
MLANARWAADGAGFLDAESLARRVVAREARAGVEGGGSSSITDGGSEGTES